MKYTALAFSMALCAVASAPALADGAATPNRCFSMRDFDGWKAADARTMYIRTGLHNYYRLDLSAPCNSLLRPGTHLVTKTRGSDQVCDGLDWELSTSDATTIGGGGVREACIVKTQTPLSDADVAAIPKQFKP